MVDGQWVTVTEAAKRLGITRTAVYNRIKRRTLQTQTDNHGHQLVNVGETVTRGTLRHVAHDTVTPTLNQETPPEARSIVAGAPEMVPMSALQQTVDALQRASNAALEAIQGQHLAEIARLRDDAVRIREDADQRVDQQRASMRWERVWFVIILAVMTVLVLVPVFVRHPSLGG